jgi:hypothetical protein
VFGYGEPTINPQFLEFLDLAGRYETLISFFLNGMSMSQELVEKLIDNQVFEITISFSGATKADYESVYIGGVWETALSGISRLARRKAERGSYFPLISVNSIAYRHHVEKLEAFIGIMADAGVHILSQAAGSTRGARTWTACHDLSTVDRSGGSTARSTARQGARRHAQWSIVSRSRRHRSGGL